MKKVYYLKEKNSNNPFYIGLTGQSLKLRLENHLSEKRGNTERVNRIKYCRENKIQIEIFLIGEYENEIAKEKEIFYIRLYRNEGVCLVNEKEGAEHTEKFKKAQSKRRLGIKNSIDTLKKMKAAKMLVAKRVMVDSVVYESMAEASKKTGVSTSFISQVCNGLNKSKSHQINYA